MRWWLFCLLFHVVIACKSDFDCAQCHSCKAGVCTPVAVYTDPNEECPERCEVKTVCGPLHICVFERKPTCNCDWMEGVCVPEPTVVVPPTVEELHKRGLSDTDIIELLQQISQAHQQYHRDAHRGHPHILPEDEMSAHDFMFIQNTVMMVLFLAVIIGVLACAWKRINVEEQMRANKAQ
jgi:hypothetical protein